VEPVGRTALIVVVPEAERMVRELRLQYDPSAAHGVRAHITLLFPFVDGHDVDEHALAELFAGHDAFGFTLDRVERWDDGIVWLHPEPSQPFAELTAAIWRRWPDHPPYAGTTETVIPHLTVGHRPVEIELDLPIRSRADAVSLIEEDAGGTWSTRRSFPLRWTPRPSRGSRLP
jgi:2'-5' RNA ligase